MTMDTSRDFNTRTYFNVVKPYSINPRCILMAGRDKMRKNLGQLKKIKKFIFVNI